MVLKVEDGNVGLNWLKSMPKIMGPFTHPGPFLSSECGNFSKPQVFSCIMGSMGGLLSLGEDALVFTWAYLVLHLENPRLLH